MASYTFYYNAAIPTDDFSGRPARLATNRSGSRGAGGDEQAKAERA
jgi:hypothetical protein